MFGVSGVVLMASFVRGRGVAGRLAVCVVVACAAAMFFVGVGATRGLGSGQSVTAVPPGFGPSAYVGLTAVSCSSSQACTGVGGLFPNGNSVTIPGSNVPEADRWNGTSWSLQPMPGPGASFQPYLAVSCPSNKVCFAAGSVPTPRLNPVYQFSRTVLIERWLHGRWSVQRFPAISVAYVLSDVSCSSPTACMAVGSIRGAPLAMRWNGRKWSIQRAATRGRGSLRFVSCLSRRACVAVGPNGPSGVAEEWNGSAWSRQRMPAMGKLYEPNGGAIRGLSCWSFTGCMALGGWDGGHLVWLWNGTRWSVKASPAKSNAVTGYAGVSCVSATWCVAGESSQVQSESTLPPFQLWNGHSWSTMRYRTSATPFGQLSDVSCASRTACIAIGSGDAYSFAWQWNGRIWTAVNPPNPPGGQRPCCLARPYDRQPLDGRDVTLLLQPRPAP